MIPPSNRTTIVEDSEQSGNETESASDEQPQETEVGGADEIPVRSVDEDSLSLLVALGLAGTGLLLGSPVLVGGATVPLLFAAAASLTGAPEPTLTLGRDLAHGEERPDNDDVLSGEPGGSVDVQLSVQNDGTTPIVDLRLVDGVPEALPVTEGTARRCLTLDPGEEATIEYTVQLQRGEHTFDDVKIRARDVAGRTTVDWQESAVGDQTLRCSPAVRQTPVGTGHNNFAGDVPTDEGGSGIEFHSVREYEPGDPVQAIDWRRYANTRELASIEYRAERAARLLCVVDARETQFREPAGSELSIIELTADAAERTTRRLLEEGHPTGVAAFDSGGVDFVSPGTGPERRKRATSLLDEVKQDHGLKASIRRLDGEPAASITQLTSSQTQIFLFSAFTDEKPLELLLQLQSQGYSVCVISPTVDAGAIDPAEGVELQQLSVGLAGLARRNRLTTARGAGATVLEWSLDDSIGAVLDRAVRTVGHR